MEKIFTIGYNSQEQKQFGFDIIDLPQLNEDEIHDWILAKFTTAIADKLIIYLPVEPDKAIHLVKIALHIRLALNDLKEKTLIPILFTSAYSLNQIISMCGIWSHIFATKGAYYASIENAKLEASAITGINYNEYRRFFLDVIKIQPDETTGRHSLANIWGAYRIDIAAKTNVFNENKLLKKNQSKLYFKYISAFNFNYATLKLPSLKVLGRISIDSPDTIDSRGKNILLIDDEADKGWEVVLRKIFRSDERVNFIVISEKIKDYESLSNESKDIIENGNFDLFLVDLRLNGLEEESIVRTSDFSGLKVLQKIKERNQGNQVIIFTASNKAWNLKNLLDEGASGYYIKESPEYNFSDDFTNQNYHNFKKEVYLSFKHSFKKTIHNDYITVLGFLKNKDFENQDFVSELREQIRIAHALAMNINIEKIITLDIAFMAYYNFLELFKQYVTYRSREYIYTVGVLEVEFISYSYGNNSIYNNGKYASHLSPSLFNILVFLLVDYFKIAGKNSSMLIDVYNITRMRNEYVHSNKSHFEINELLLIVQFSVFLCKRMEE